MKDIISTLVAKKAKLFEAKRKIQEEATRQCATIDAELKQIDSAIAVINNACKPFICPVCDGTGEENYTDAAGSRDTRPCTSCGGTGIVTNTLRI